MAEQGVTPEAYTAAFLRAVDRVLADEGGYVDNPADPGGETAYGISRQEYPCLDLKKLTRQDAIALYYRDFWCRGRYADLPEPVAEKLFDLAVNIGPEAAARCLQRALRAAGRRVADDGVIGDLTVLAACAAEKGALLSALRSEAAGHYRVVAARWPGGRAVAEREFLQGWLNRAYR